MYNLDNEVKVVRRSMMGLLCLAFSLAIAGCGVKVKPQEIPIVNRIVKKPDLQELLVKAAGPFEQKLELGGGWLLLSAPAGENRALSYLIPEGDGWKRQGEPVMVAAGASVRVESGLVLAEVLKAGVSRVKAFEARPGDTGLVAVDFYRLRAPEPTVKTGAFVLVDKRINKLYQYQDGGLIKVFDIATGRQTDLPAPTWDDYKTNFFTPEGLYTLTNFVENPGYNALKPGDKSYAGGEPGNPLGTRWMGFEVLKGDNAWIWGIHGTSEPEKIGTWASDGCIRMNTADAEELFAALRGKNARLQIVGK